MQTEEQTQDQETEFRGEATYCPEDNKLRLYVGRVPREDYLRLRDMGWTATPKQRENGGCDFVATWSVERRALCLEWCGVIGDEDQSPAERAADRAERFAGYREKRLSEATGHADRYDAGPSAHGYQSQARAERAAARHDRIATHAVDAWSKAEYWTQRTAGVISHALYKSRPDVRMGRIKELEAELRRYSNSTGLYAEHLKMRLAYENQMLEAQGGRAGVVEMVPGGRLGNHLIVKVCKSNVTGRVVSVWVKGEKIRGWTYRAKDVSGADYSLHQIETERLSATAYTAPDEASLAELAKHVDHVKEKRSKIKPVPLINPTEADAQKLQEIWNAAEKNPGQVVKMTQAQYSALSGGTYSAAKTVVICETGREHRSRYGQNITRHDVFKIRLRKCGDYSTADRVVVITDKPQKPLPWKELEKLQKSEPTREKLRGRLLEAEELFRGSSWAPNKSQLFQDLRYVGWAYYDSESQFGFSDAGHAELKAVKAEQLATA